MTSAFFADATESKNAQQPEESIQTDANGNVISPGSIVFKLQQQTLKPTRYQKIFMVRSTLQQINLYPKTKLTLHVIRVV